MIEVSKHKSSSPGLHRSNTALAGGLTAKYLWTQSLLAGAFYYLYNEVAFLALGRVNPVTHAVGNTIKRVVIIVASVIAFKTPISCALFCNFAREHIAL